jgi:NADPH-dependent glutamate synthase beta subunit-like oxidoreductase
VHGRVCYHPCEDACNRKDLDDAVSIHAVERFLGDQALEQGWTLPCDAQPSGKRVLVVGAGPSGLSAAWHLRLRGHQVVVRDAGPVAGGMMHFGIPKYRLPRRVLDREIERIAAMGIEIELNHKVTNLVQEQIGGRFDAVFLAIGAHLGKRLDIPARDAGRIYDALQFLKAVEFGDDPPRLGRRVAIYGGGNTAMDAARTAQRLGAEPVIIYRRTRAEMPAHDCEADDALTEGVKIHWLRTITDIDESSVRVEMMRLDENRYPQPTGEFETLEVDSLILALGQDTDTAFLTQVPGLAFKKDGTVVVGPDMQTGRAGVFAGGDMVPYARTVTTAVGHGKQAARHIDAFLRREIWTRPAKHERATLEMLRLWYQAEAQTRAQRTIDLPRRRQTFEEVVDGLDAESARYEAQRCLSCGNCFECDGCYSACPEHAVLKLGPGRRYEYDLARCTGCAICYAQCPCGAIAMVPEPSDTAAL